MIRSSVLHIDALHPDPLNIRKVGNVDELAASIRSQGILERDEAIARLVSAGCTQGAAEIHLRGMMLSKRRADGAK